ncbi:hypothetical protein KJA16_00725 [Patescibacteria group bacterium]|nr:hypothetical protein [Patescibacteria group bacterium]MBZ9578219.1 hypothetical protein [Patescibacteria group bacterium]
MGITPAVLKKWEKDLPVVGHPIRLAILFALCGAEILEKQKELKKTLRTPSGFIQYYFGVLRLAGFFVKKRKFAELLWFLVVWPIKFVIYLKIGTGILLPFSIEPPIK